MDGGCGKGGMMDGKGGMDGGFGKGGMMDGGKGGFGKMDGGCGGCFGGKGKGGKGMDGPDGPDSNRIEFGDGRSGMPRQQTPLIRAPLLSFSGGCGPSSDG